MGAVPYLASFPLKNRTEMIVANKRSDQGSANPHPSDPRSLEKMELIPKIHRININISEEGYGRPPPRHQH